MSFSKQRYIEWQDTHLVEVDMNEAQLPPRNCDTVPVAKRTQMDEDLHALKRFLNGEDILWDDTTPNYIGSNANAVSAMIARVAGDGNAHLGRHRLAAMVLAMRRIP